MDAIAIRTNAIPILGKTISNRLREQILTHKVRNIYLALDPDAVKDTQKLAKYFLNQGINTYWVKLDDDPSALGYDEVWKRIDEAKPLTFGDLLRTRLSNI